MLALGLVVIGVIAYRWDINLSGLLVVMSYLPGQPTVNYTSYTPSLVELVSGLGIIAYGLLAFSLGVRYLTSGRPSVGAGGDRNRKSGSSRNHSGIEK